MSESHNQFRVHGFALAAAVCWALIPAMQVAFGDPPGLAPAHGWRARNDARYLGYTGKKWDRDYGILDGRCNRQSVGAVLGAAARGAKGSHFSGEDRPVATIVGSVLGPMVGVNNGRDMDEKDRACLAYTLELAGAERNVAWTNTDTGAAYTVVPLDGYSKQGRSCREFVTRISAHGHDDMIRQKACSEGDGVWRIVG